MSDENPLPTPRYTIEFKGHAQTWRDLEGIVRQMQTDLAYRLEPGAFTIVSGGGWNVTVEEPDPTQTPERWWTELDEWAERNSALRKGGDDE